MYVLSPPSYNLFFFFFQAEDGIRDKLVTGVQTCALPIYILSIAANHAYPNWSVYCASKFGLDGLSSAVREELRSRKVRVLNIYPAATDTDIWKAVQGEWPRERMVSAADVANAVAYACRKPA